MEYSELSKIGLTSGEIKVYEALIELGECTKTSLAKKSGIAPSNIYDVTNRLVEKGIISRVKKNGIAHFSPANPKHIVDFIDEKKEILEKERSVVNAILPTLMMKFNETHDKVDVEVFQGWNGLKTIFEDLISECSKGEQCYVFGASKGENDKQADLFFTKYSKLREEKGIMTDIIFNEEVRKRKDRIDFFLKSKAYNVRFIDQSTPSEIMLYRKKACILMLTKNPLAIRISSKEAFDSFKQYFDVMWKNSKE
jgi:sugar-specific transcriptional regulator TrmB